MEQGNWEIFSFSVDTVGKTNFQLVKQIFFSAYGFGMSPPSGLKLSHSMHET